MPNVEGVKLHLGSHGKEEYPNWRAHPQRTLITVVGLMVRV
jgi:hypothetical protein